MKQWMEMRASDFIEFNPQMSIKKGTIATKISMDKLQPFTKKIAETEKAAFSGGSKFRNGDTIMARITPCLENGKTAFVDILEEDETAFGSTEFIVMRARESISDPQFIYYLSTSPSFRNIAIKSMVGSSGRQRVQQRVLENFILKIPSLKEQKKISSILCILDQKIAFNNAINNNLEQQAMAIFSNEFLTLETLPDGWKQSSLIDIADYLNGLAMQKYPPTADESGIPVLKIKELRQGCCDVNSELCSSNIKSEYIIHDGDVIFSWSGSLLVDFWCGGICGLNQHLFKVTSNKYDKWFYYAWTRHHLDRFIAVAADKATTMGHIKRDELAKADILIPKEAEYNRIGALLQPIYDLIIANRIENKKLAEIRDTLLPRLMSGELDVSDVEI